MNNDEKKMIVTGYAIVFSQPTILWVHKEKEIYEIIDPQALNECDLSEVDFKYNHSHEVLIVASTTNKSLRLKVDKKGLWFRAELANTQMGRDLYEMVRTRLLSKMSFAFVLEEESYDRQKNTRIIKKLNKFRKSPRYLNRPILKRAYA